MLYLTSLRDKIQPNHSFIEPIPDISSILCECKTYFAGHFLQAKQKLASDLCSGHQAMEQDGLATQQPPKLVSYKECHFNDIDAGL